MCIGSLLVVSVGIHIITYFTSLASAMKDLWNTNKFYSILLQSTLDFPGKD
jgi:hypothetical protein